MRICRIGIRNFTNFRNFEVRTGRNVVVVGENKVGKSNLLFALQLIFDPSLSERDRRLGLEHFWDGLGDDKLGETIEISVDLTDFDVDPRLVAHLGGYLIDPGPPMISRLTYRYQPMASLEGQPGSLADYEYLLFGGMYPDTPVGSTLRRMLPLDLLPALRDAEKDLANWRRSPLRPLIEDLAGTLSVADRDAILDAVDGAQAALSGRPEVEAVARTIGGRLEGMVGPAHATSVALGLAPSRLDALLRALRLLIDRGERGIAEASLGTTNLVFLALKSLELDRLIQDGERDYTFLAVEEPEAHLHPHVQRLVYRHFLETAEVDDEDVDEDPPGRAGDATAGRHVTILTTHSPHIASIAPLRSIVLLRRQADGSTEGVSTAEIPLDDAEVDDLQRYIDVTRGELFFSRGVILVEGDAERFLVPAFADALDIHLDELGISVCSVSGTNFAPYVKLLGPSGLRIPFVVLTDRDELPDGTVLGPGRVRGLLGILRPGRDYEAMDEAEVFRRGALRGIFVNSSTLEPALFATGMRRQMVRVLKADLPLRRANRELLDGWEARPSTLEPTRLIKLIERIGKGRFAQRIAPAATAERCPAYIREALERIRDEVA
ncbi:MULTISPECIES: AAA family ATPase [unclassified Methylobacterium]|uniref:AAA family ATPase n=1 Tax=unclassified Methylobacterium TaxID=2615210 RepID=UPI00135575F2|nr:AAA family ATPase [Methylobacterium sp. 2A]